MSGGRILVVDIAGVDTALATSSRGVSQWAVTVAAKLKMGSIPPGMSLSVDPSTGQSDTGALSLQARDISALLTDVSVTATTRIDGAISATDTSIDVLDASGLDPSGRIWVGKEAIDYSGISTNTLTGCTRARLGTYATSHGDASSVYASNPTFLGRRVELSWQDAAAPSTSTAWSRWVGFIDNIGWSDGYYVLGIISASKLAMDSKALASPYVKGRLSADFPGTLKDLYLDHDDDDNPWTEYDATRGYAHVRIGDEIIKIEQVIRPSDKETINSLTGPDKLYVDFPSKFRPGQTLDVTDASGNLRTGGQGITVIDIHDAASASSYLTVAGLNGYSYTSGDQVRANYTSVIPSGRIERGCFGTTEQEHEAGAEATEVRAIVGDLVEDVLLPLLCSVDGSGTNGPSSGAYDILPSGWGAGIPSAYIDLDALRSIGARSTNRRYLWTDAVQLTDLLAWAAQTTNASIFWTEQGQISAILRDDQYPGTVMAHSVDSSWHREQTIPQLDIRTENLYNAAEVRMDHDPISNESRHTLFIEIADSIERYGRRHLEIRDPGLLQTDTEDALTAILQGWLRYRSLPYPEVTIPIRLAESTTYRPGQLVSLSLPHLPNMQGGQGLLDTWEIVEVNPSDAQGQIDLRLIYRGPAPRVAHVAPAGIVEEVRSTTEIILSAASSTNLAPSSYSGLLPAYESDGDEDVDWFIEGDRITLWDKSTLGGTPTTTNVTIDTINYSTRSVIFTSTLPVWLAAGDLVRLQNYASIQGGATELDREGILIALADSAASPPDLAGDDAYVWGM